MLHKSNLITENVTNWLQSQASLPAYSTTFAGGLVVLRCYKKKNK